MVWSSESRQSRGYGAAWEKIRAQVVKRDKGLCQCCLRAGRVAVGREVDHKVCKAKAARLGWSQARMDDPANLELLCPPCHRAKTAAENGRVYQPKVEYGVDGWPLDKSD